MILVRPHLSMPKQSLRPSPFGVNAFGKSNRGTPELSTFTVTVAVEEHPYSLVAVTLYVVFVSGDACGLAMDISLNPAAGDHS